PLACEVDPVAVAAVRDAANLLSDLGHHVEQIDPPWRLPGLQELFGRVFAVAIATSIAASGLAAGREPTPDDMEPRSWAVYRLGRAPGAVDAARNWAHLQAMTRQVVAWLVAGPDVVLTPSLAERPLPIGTLDTAAERPLDTYTRSAWFTPFTAIANAS